MPEATDLSRDNFQDWLREGWHDCDAAKEMRRFWFYVRPGSSHDTEADFFDQLYTEFAETLPEAAHPRRRRRGDGDNADEDAPRENELPVTFLAELLRSSGYVPFDTAGLEAAAIITELCSDILEEVAKVQAYVGAWRGSTLVAEPARQGIAEATEEICRDAVRPWPVIEKEPVATSEEGRFVKAFPLEFPMGVADLKQPQLREDYSALE